MKTYRANEWSDFEESVRMLVDQWELETPGASVVPFPMSVLIDAKNAGVSTHEAAMMVIDEFGRVKF